MSETEPRRQGPQWTWQFWTAVGIVVGFTLLVAIMLLNVGGDEIVWQRRVYLFGAVEAVVFTAVGWIFGREVHRSAAASAEQDAAAAKEDAQSARAEAKELTTRAVTAEQRAAQESLKGKAVQAAVHSITSAAPPSGPRDVSASASVVHEAAMRQLRNLVDDLYGLGPVSPLTEVATDRGGAG